VLFSLLNKGNLIEIKRHNIVKHYAFIYQSY